MKEFIEFRQWIDEAKPLIRHKNLRFLRDIDSNEIAIKSHYIIGKSFYDGWPVTKTCHTIGREVSPSSDLETQWRIGYMIIHILAKNEKIDLVRGSQLQVEQPSRKGLFKVYHKIMSKSSTKKGDRSPKMIKILDSKWIDNFLVSVPVSSNAKVK